MPYVNIKLTGDSEAPTQEQKDFTTMMGSL